MIIIILKLANYQVTETIVKKRKTIIKNLVLLVAVAIIIKNILHVKMKCYNLVWNTI